MKIQIDLPDTELWARFKDEVTRQGKTLREVVPTVFEPALRWYLHDPPLTTPTTTPYKNICYKCGKEIKDVEFISGDGMQKLCLTCMNLPNPMNTPPEQPSEEEISRTINPPYPPVTTVKRCDLCDMPTERTFNDKGRRVCYTCWRDGIINDATSKTSLPEAPTSSA